MFVPYSTDAPVYHWPFATVGIGVLCIALSFLVWTGAVDEVTAVGLFLTWGDGVHPAQWFTSIFLHEGIWHLIINLFWLWVFGLVVEGKLGWWRFLLVFLAIGVGECAIEQVLMLGAEGGATVGASAFVYGLLAMAWIWAPESKVEFFYLLIIRPGTISVRLRTTATVFLAIECLFAVRDFAMDYGVTGSLLHLLGGAIGLPLGIVLLKKGIVDCEGWDVFTLRKRKGERRSDARAAPKKLSSAQPPPEVSVASETEDRETALQLIEGYLAGENASLADEVYRENRGDGVPWELPEPVLGKLIQGLGKTGRLASAKPYLREFIRRFPGRAANARLLLAKHLIEAESRPASGLEVLNGLPAALGESQARAREILTAKAKKLQAEGVIEMELDSESGGD